MELPPVSTTYSKAKHGKRCIGDACRVRSKMGDRGKEEFVVEQKVGVALLTASFKPP